MAKKEGWIKGAIADMKASRKFGAIKKVSKKKVSKKKGK